MIHNSGLISSRYCKACHEISHILFILCLMLSQLWGYSSFNISYFNSPSGRLLEKLLLTRKKYRIHTHSKFFIYFSFKKIPSIESTCRSDMLSTILQWFKILKNKLANRSVSLSYHEKWHRSQQHFQDWHVPWLAEMVVMLHMSYSIYNRPPQRPTAFLFIILCTSHNG